MKQRMLKSCPAACWICLLVGCLMAETLWAQADTAKGSFNMGQEARQKGDTASAIIYYTAAIAADPAFTDAYLNLGSLLFAQKRYEEAAANFKKLTELDPAQPLGLANYGKTLSALEKYDEAVLAYQAALKADPGYAEGNKELGKAYYKLKKYDDCISSLQAFVKTDTTDSYPYYLIGMAFKNKKDDKQAITFLKTATERDPADFDAIYNLGNIYLGQSNYANAITCFKKGLELKPKHFKCAYNRAVAIESNDPENRTAAIAAWEQFLGVGRKNPQAKDFVASSEEHLKQLKEAAKGAGQ